MKKGILLFTSLAGVTLSQGALFTSGELDFGVILEDGEFELEGHVVSGVVDGQQTDDVEFEASELEVLAGADRRFAASDDLPAAGVLSGESLWILPQSQVAGVPFIALASEELDSSDWDGPITFALGSVVSPSGTGTFSMWTSDGLGDLTFYFSSTNVDATVDDNQFVSNFSHDHVNWGFSEAGEWQIDLIASGDRADMGEVSTTETLTFTVIPEPSTSLLAGLSALGLLARRRR